MEDTFKKLFLVVAIILIVFIVMFFTGCATQYHCQPTKKSRDYAITNIRHIKSGYVVSLKSYFDEKKLVYECLPDSFKVGKVVSI